MLAPGITGALDDAGRKPADIAAIVAGLGPGPFTGLRVGLVTAASMADALGIPVYGVCTLDGLGATTAGRVLVATDARRREVYYAVYDDGVRVAGPSVGKPTALDLPEGVTAAVGDGAQLYREALGLPVADLPRYPSAATLARVAVPRVLGRAPSETLTPLYLRRPDAVEPGARKAVS